MSRIMQIYRRHYWSIWIDFIEAFKQLEYKGVPLPLLCVDIYRYLDENLIKLMSNASFESYLKNKIFNETDIQRAFDQFVVSFKKNPHPTHSQTSGKIVLENYVLRLPEEMILKYFNRDQVIYIKEGESCVNIHGIQSYGTEKYRTDNSQLVENYIEKLNEIFSSFNQHPIFGNVSFQKKLISDIPEMVDKLVTVNNFFEQVPVSCVVIGAYETFLIRSLIFVSQSRGIPSIWLEHGIIGDAHNYGWLPVLATKHAVYGQFEIDWYMERGVSKERLEITGNVSFDRIFTNKHMSKEEFNKKLGLHSETKKVLFATNADICKIKWGKMAEGLLQYPSLEIIIKSHQPGSENERTLYNEIRAKYKSIALIERWDFKIHDVLPNVDVVVIDLSTVGLEGMLFDKPVVCLIEPSRSSYNYEYYSIINEFVESDPLKAAQIIIQLFTDKNIQILNKKKRESFLSYAYPQKLSSDKLVKLINEITK